MLSLMPGHLQLADRRSLPAMCAAQRAALSPVRRRGCDSAAACRRGESIQSESSDCQCPLPVAPRVCSPALAVTTTYGTTAGSQ